MANVDRTRKLLVRTALVTSSTIATLVGAQNLALQDVSPTEQVASPTIEQSGIPTAAAVSTIEAALVIPISPTNAVAHAAPSVIILRRAGQSGPIQQQALQPASIQPPVPMQVAAPEPVFVQGEAPPPIIVQQQGSGGGQPTTTTQSSR